MDAVLAGDFAYNVSRFIDAASECLSAIPRLDESSSDPPDDQDINDLAQALLEHTGRVHFSPPDGVSLLSEEDEILLRLAKHCQQLSSQLVMRLQQLDTRSNLESQFGVTTGTMNTGDSSRQVLNVIREDLNEHLATHQWSTISRMIRELGAKNGRLMAKRTTEIEQLASDVDAYFQNIKSKELEHGQTKSHIWLQVRAATQRAMDYSTEQIILGTLQFWTMDRRKELISKKHENTFEWILAQGPSEEDASEPASNFVDWLSIDEPLYWITGKPGSGKSTLMKFVAENSKTIDGLRRWAADDVLIIASFYFWSAAKDPLQKSGTGLLRSILFQILRECPDLIQHAFPDQWNDRQSPGSMQRFARAEKTTSELLASYQRMSALLSTTNVKFCFFVDGLDEYDGEPADIIDLIESLSKTDNLKTCISSRQWAEFEAIFGGQKPWKLAIHQLTRGDIRLYVEDLLNSDDRFGKMKEASSEEDIQSLVTTTVENAEGVFLWVLLVVRSLLDGLSDGDQILDLLNKLAEIPNNLDGYFDKMFLDIDLHMREQTAHVFEITLNAVEKLPLMAYWFMQEETLGGTKTVQSQQQPLSRETATERLTEIEKWLDTYSQGLLKADSTVHDKGLSSELEEHQWLFEFRVDFLHRTVADFLRTAHMTKLLKRWSAGSFDADLEICKASLATIKVTPPTIAMFQDAPRVPSILHLFMSHAQPLEGESRVDLLDACLSSLEEHSKTLSELQTMILGPGNFWAYQSSFYFVILYHCVSYGLGDYVVLQLDRGELQFPEPSAALLSGCLSWDPRVRMGKLTLNIHTIELLLRRGLDPNLPWGDRGVSFWQQLLITTYSRHLKGIVTPADCDAIMCAVDHGADMEASIEVFAARRLGSTKAVNIVEKVLPREQFLILRLGGHK